MQRWPSATNESIGEVTFTTSLSWTGWATVSAAAPDGGWWCPGSRASRSPAAVGGAGGPNRAGSASYSRNGALHATHR